MKRKIKKQEKLVNDLTLRLVRCPIHQFHDIQKELFKQQAILKEMRNTI